MREHVGLQTSRSKNGIVTNIKTEPISLPKDSLLNQQHHNLFSVGSLVFAKLKGFRAWPARITSVKKRKYDVFFFGTYDTATLSQKGLFKYTDFTVNKFSIKLTNSKISKLFQIALTEISTDSLEK